MKEEFSHLNENDQPKMVDVGAELQLSTDAFKPFENDFPEFVKVMYAYPEGADCCEHVFRWVKVKIRKRPAFALSHTIIQANDEFALDATRVTLMVGNTGYDGDTFKNAVLMDRYGIQINKTSRNTVLFMTNIGTTRSSVAFLIEVLVKIATELEQERPLVLAVPPLRSNVNLSRIVRAAGCCGRSGKTHGGWRPNRSRPASSRWPKPYPPSNR